MCIRCQAVLHLADAAMLLQLVQMVSVHCVLAVLTAQAA